MLINLSNHPYDEWEEAQKNAAIIYGECVDMDFPAVDADADESYIIDLANDFFERIFELSQTNKVTVHVMGEMTFTCALVSKLLQNNIHCIASTSERNSNNLGNGQKEIVFKFKRFRNYVI